MILGVDWGNSEVKVCGPLGLDKFLSDIGEYWERNLTNEHGKDDMEFEYEGRRGFAGTLADNESDFGGSIMGDTKAHEDALIRLLLACYRYSDSTHYQIVVGQPIDKHSHDKEEIKRMVEGKHTITVNGVSKTFHITNCTVAAEGATSFFSNPLDGLVRIIDIGSATVNCATIKNRKYVNKDSFTLPLGMNTVRIQSLSELARGIYTTTSKRWRKGDTVLLAGGIAERMVEPMRRYYPDCDVMKPAINEGGYMKIAIPIFANCIGFYNVGRAIYEKDGR